MTTTSPATADTAPPTPGRGPSWHGIRTVMTLDLRQRVRSTRWQVALAVWFVIVGVITWLVTAAAGWVTDDGGFTEAQEAAGRTVFGLILMFVLLLGLLITPTMSASSINGDRQNGTLAILQATTLSSWDLTLGKLLAAWATSLAFLAISLPFLAFGLSRGGTGVGAGVVAIGIVALILLVVCGIGLGCSALTSRPAGSAVLTYLIVAGLTIGTPIAFGLSAVFVGGEEEVQVRDFPEEFWETHDWAEGDPTADDLEQCVWRTETQHVQHFERTAWLLGLNPFVIVADAATIGQSVSSAADDPMSGLSFLVRSAQQPPQTEFDYCEGYGALYYEPEEIDPGAPIWPWGMAALLVLGAGGTWTAQRRLRTPAGVLPKGVRIA